MAPAGPKMAQDRTVPMELSPDASRHDPKRGQGGPKMTKDDRTVLMELAQAWPQVGQRCTQDGAKMGKFLRNCPKKSQKGQKQDPKRGQDDYKKTQGSSKIGQLLWNVPHVAPKRGQDTPKGPKVDQDWAVPMELPQDAFKPDPKRGQDGTKRTQNGPKIG
jgi:hypothetical protein